MSENNPKIFVSYAHVDNQSHNNKGDGWVSLFVHNMGVEISRRIGRSEHYDMWVDFRLKTNDAVTPEIDARIRDADVLVILMSSGWLGSDWCRKELAIFCDQYPEAGVDGRIFVINQDDRQRREMPQDIQDLVTIPYYKKTIKGQIRQLGYPYPDPKAHQEYFDRLCELSDHLSAALKKFKNRIVQASAPFENAEDKRDCPAVYIAPVHDALHDQRVFLVSELNQFGISVLPAENRKDRDMEDNLKKCSFFVQLLDEQYVMGIPHENMKKAESHDLTILQWRDPSLDISNIDNREQQAMLEGTTVRACELSDFSRQVREVLFPPEEPGDDDLIPAAENGGQTVFVLASQEDFDCAYEVRRNLKSSGWGTILPRYTGNPAKVRKNIESGYQHCDVLLVMQQQASADLVDDYLKGALIHARKEVEILVCQSDQAEELYFTPAGVQTLTCNSHFKDDCLAQFLGEVSK